MNRKAVVLFSGGLDSILATKLILEQGVEVYALHFFSIFCDFKSKKNDRHIEKIIDILRVPLKVIDITQEFLEIVKDPRYGRGSNMNPCIDCRIFSFKKAKDYMNEIGASFIVTGEVVGERPMSQTRHAISLIEKRSGLNGLIVRPLSARLLEPSVPEKEGVVDRDRLMDIQGRKRDRQFALAKRFGITEYPNPAGGCLLTDKGFSNRLKDLFRYSPNYDICDIHLLKTGRQFRINGSAKLIVGRNKRENEILLSFSKPGDYIFDIIGIPSPIGLVRGSVSEEEIALSSSIVARYSDAKSDKVKVSYKKLPSEKLILFITKPTIDQEITPLRI